MLSGVLFRWSETTEMIQPEFTNRYILTDVYLSAESSFRLETPILPSIATLVRPSNTINIIRRLCRTIALITLSHLPGSQHAIKRISVANTALIFHQNRALATCESGPPMRISLPDLATVGWYTGNNCEGEGTTIDNNGFGGRGLLSFFKEWTTAHVYKILYYTPCEDEH